MISHSVLLRTRIVWKENCEENRNTYFMFNKLFFENLALYEILWKNIVQLDRPQTTIWFMCMEYWISKATSAYSECVIRIAFPLQKFLNGRTSVLRFTYIACLFCIYEQRSSENEPPEPTGLAREQVHSLRRHGRFLASAGNRILWL
jgi:hypothetical protein